mmetsp:Transcript_19919/g.36086  ORF Transcript_19919/g.36086 Transcript_19919/m.36086 type:complete len:133 (+) Transcript_19919:592-990(+)
MLVPDKKPGSIAGMFGRGDLIHEHAGAFAESCNVWAPRYRQMGFLAQGQNLDANDPTVLANVKASMAMALADLKAAFKAFLAQRPDKTRPFVIAAHSQVRAVPARPVHVRARKILPYSVQQPHDVGPRAPSS